MVICLSCEIHKTKDQHKLLWEQCPRLRYGALSASPVPVITDITEEKNGTVSHRRVVWIQTMQFVALLPHIVLLLSVLCLYFILSTNGHPEASATITRYWFNIGFVNKGASSLSPTPWCLIHKIVTRTRRQILHVSCKLYRVYCFRRDVSGLLDKLFCWRSF